MRMEFTIDMHGVRSELDVIRRFAKELQIEAWFGDNIMPSWDAFLDDMRSLETESKIIRESEEVVDEIDFKILSYFDISNFVNEKTSEVLSEILIGITDPTQQNQIKKIRFEVYHLCTHPEHAS